MTGLYTVTSTTKCPTCKGAGEIEARCTLGDVFYELTRHLAYETRKQIIGNIESSRDYQWTNQADAPSDKMLLLLRTLQKPGAAQ